MSICTFPQMTGVKIIVKQLTLEEMECFVINIANLLNEYEPDTPERRIIACESNYILKEQKFNYKLSPMIRRVKWLIDNNLIYSFFNDCFKTIKEQDGGILRYLYPTRDEPGTIRMAMIWNKSSYGFEYWENKHKEFQKTFGIYGDRYVYKEKLTYEQLKRKFL